MKKIIYFEALAILAALSSLIFINAPDVKAEDYPPAHEVCSNGPCLNKVGDAWMDMYPGAEQIGQETIRTTVNSGMDLATGEVIYYETSAYSTTVLVINYNGQIIYIKADCGNPLPADGVIGPKPEDPGTPLPPSGNGGADIWVRNSSGNGAQFTASRAHKLIFSRPGYTVEFEYGASTAAWTRGVANRPNPFNAHDNDADYSCSLSWGGNGRFAPNGFQNRSARGDAACSQYRHGWQYWKGSSGIGMGDVGQSFTQTISVSPTVHSVSSDPHHTGRYEQIPVYGTIVDPVTGESSYGVTGHRQGDEIIEHPSDVDSFTGSATASATAKVPYNYNADPDLSINASGVVDSGTSIGVTGNFVVRDRPNGEVSSVPYATKSYDSQWKIIKYLVPPGGSAGGAGFGGNSDLCSVYPHSSYIYNNAETGCVNVASGGGVFNPGSANVHSDAYFADDVPVGTQVCYAMGVYPASSYGPHGNSQDNNAATGGSPSNPVWRYGNPSCVTIGKKPKVEILGSGLSTPGTVSTSQTLKSYGSGGNALAIMKDTSRRLYGSWSEYETVGGNVVKTSTGLTGTATGAGTGSYGLASGSSRPDIGKWSRQTITNTSDDNLGRYTRASLATAQTRFSNSCGNVASCQHSTSSIIGNVVVPRGQTLIWSVDGSATINGNITYENGAYSSLGELPQAIIIVNGNLNIEPQVTQIDAWIIVTGTLNTCTGFNIGSSGINACNNKIVFNGPVATGKVALNRTGGSGVNNSLRNAGCGQGINSCHGTGRTVYTYNGNEDASGDPGEVFNLRSDAYLWAYYHSLAGGQARTTYVREVPPRF